MFLTKASLTKQQAIGAISKASHEALANLNTKQLKIELCLLRELLETHNLFTSIAAGELLSTELIAYGTRTDEVDRLGIINHYASKGMKIARWKPDSWQEIFSDSKVNLTIEKLLDCGLPPNTKDSKGRSMLHNAVHYGQEDLVKYLVRKGASLNIKDNDSTYPIQDICGLYDTDRIKMLETLLTAKANPNKANASQSILEVLLLVAQGDDEEGELVGWRKKTITRAMEILLPITTNRRKVMQIINDSNTLEEIYGEITNKLALGLKRKVLNRGVVTDGQAISSDVEFS